MSKDSLGDRMKNYENSFRFTLPKRIPLIIRIDGSHFHTYTKDCKRPWDESLVDTMNQTAAYLCKNIQGCQLGYVQSDEISLLLNNYQDIDTQAWFDNTLQKMVSTSAAMASAVFTTLSPNIFGKIKMAMFDSRIFLVPKEDVVNYFLWRQQDCTRNSVQMLARSLYSHKECNNKNNSDLQEMCFQKGYNWNDCNTEYKRGRCIVKEITPVTGHNPRSGVAETTWRSKWVVDNKIPIFSEERLYIEKFI